MLSQARWINSKPKKLQISHRAMTCRFRSIEGGGGGLTKRAESFMRSLQARPGKGGGAWQNMWTVLRSIFVSIQVTLQQSLYVHSELDFLEEQQSVDHAVLSNGRQRPVFLLDNIDKSSTLWIYPYRFWMLRLNLAELRALLSTHIDTLVRGWVISITMAVVWNDSSTSIETYHHCSQNHRLLKNDH